MIFLIIGVIKMSQNMLKNKPMKKGEYAEIMTKYAEHIFRESISSVDTNVKMIALDETEREIDVVTTLTSGERIAFEVRDRKAAQGIDWIDQVVGKYSTLGFDFVWICTFDGCSLSSGAIKKLKYHNIGWRDFTLLSENICGRPPVLMVEGIELIDEDSEMTVNNELYKDVEYTMSEGENPISLKDNIKNLCRSIIQCNFKDFDKIDEFIYEDKLSLYEIENNFSSETAEIRASIPLKHTVYVDYINEEYMIRNNENQERLLSTENKTVFIAGDTLVVNFEYLARIAVNAILNNNCILNIKTIPEMYKKIKKLKFIDASGKGIFIPMKVYGIKEL